MNRIKQKTSRIFRDATCLCGVGLLVLCGVEAPAWAQDAELELPDIVVESTTIAVSKDVKRKKKGSASPYNSASSLSATTGGSGSASSGTVAGPNNDADFSNAPDPNSSAAEEFDGEHVAGQLIQNQGSAVTVVTSKQLKEQQIRHAGDALRALPGVHVSRSGGPQSNTVARIRGAESNHTLVLIDGVEVNSTDGSFDFSNLTTEEIEKIEILRGPQSALYSSGAIGGVISIHTKAGKGPLTIRARGEAGTLNTQGGALQISAGNDRLHGIFTLSGRQTDGFNLSVAGSEDDEANFSNFAFSGGAQILPNVKIDATLRRSKTDADRDDFDGTRPDGFGELIDTQSRVTSDLHIGRLAMTIDTFEKMWTHKLQIAGMESDLEDDGRGSIVAVGQFVTERTDYSYTSTLRIEPPTIPRIRHYVTAHAEQQRETFVRKNTNAFGFVNLDGERERTGLAGEIRGEYFDALYLSGAVRHDDNDSFEDFTTWSASGSLKMLQTPVRLHATVGEGVKYPSLFELFGSFPGGVFIANPNLTPEESFGWDAGVEIATPDRKALVDVTYFSQNLENEIDIDFLPTFASTAINRTGESKREGVEVAGHIEFGQGLRLGASYTYLKAREDDGSEEIRRPPHSGRLDVNYNFDQGRANLNLAAVYNGEMFDKAFNSNTFTALPVKLDEFLLLTAAASYKVTPGVEVYGRVENLLDEDYTEVVGINTAPIAAYAGLRFTYVEEQTRAWAEGR